MLLYCDSCASKHGYDIQSTKKSKGECGLCHMRIGPMNELTDRDMQFITNNISKDVVKISGFTIKEIAGFPVGTKVPEIDPTSPRYKVIANNCVIFYGVGNITLALTTTGKRIQIDF